MAKNLELMVSAITAASLLLLLSAVRTTNAIANEARLSSHCERQLRWEKMDHCRQYLKSEMDVIMFPNSGNQACCLRECCEMLQDMDEDCVCEAVETVTEEVPGGEWRRGMGRVVVRKKAMQLPGRCGIRVGCEVSVLIPPTLINLIS